MLGSEAGRAVAPQADPYQIAVVMIVVRAPEEGDELVVRREQRALDGSCRGHAVDDEIVRRQAVGFYVGKVGVLGVVRVTTGYIDGAWDAPEGSRVVKISLEHGV